MNFDGVRNNTSSRAHAHLWAWHVHLCKHTHLCECTHIGKHMHIHECAHIYASMHAFNGHAHIHVCSFMWWRAHASSMGCTILCEHPPFYMSTCHSMRVCTIQHEFMPFHTSACHSTQVHTILCDCKLYYASVCHSMPVTPYTTMHPTMQSCTLLHNHAPFFHSLTWELWFGSGNSCQSFCACSAHLGIL